MYVTGDSLLIKHNIFELENALSQPATVNT